MTVEEKLQTEVITTEQAIYCLQHIEDVDGDKCSDCPYVDVCSEKGIEEKIAQMAIKALEENEGLRKEADNAKHSHAIVSALYNNLFEAHEKLKKEVVPLREERAKLKERLLFLEPKAELEKEELQRAIQKAREEMQSLRGCSCSCSDGIIDDVEEILDKHLRGGE